VFNSVAYKALQSNSDEFLKLARQTLQTILTEAKSDYSQKEQAIQQLVSPLKDSLNRYEGQIREMERERGKAYGEMKNQLEQLSRSEEVLRKETDNLVRALKTPQVKGRWGEMALRRAVELAGMTNYCDFEEQVSTDTEEGRKRPDMVIHLPMDRVILVDAKVPLTAYTEAIYASDENTRTAAFKRHAELVRNHIKVLSSKSYWNDCKETPEFVVLFLPGESFFSAALEQEPGLLEESANNRVILSSPTTLIALLKAVAYGWKQQEIADNAQKIAQTGKELYERVCNFVEHIDKIRNGLIQANESFNDAIGSWEHRVVPAARKLKELGAASSNEKLKELKPTDVYMRRISGGNDAR
jgi:DNA recombination protein RmuC